MLTAERYNEGEYAHDALNSERAVAAILMKFYNGWGNLERARTCKHNNRQKLPDLYTQSYGEPAPSPKHYFTAPSIY